MTPVPPRRPADKPPPDPHRRIQIEDVLLNAVIDPCRHTVEAVNHQVVETRKTSYASLTGGEAASLQNPPSAAMHENFIDVVLDGQLVRALVDSGASLSVISETFRRQLKKLLFCSSQNLTFRVADGSHVKPLGTCILRVTMQNKTRSFEFTVMPKCRHNVILGWDFLKAFQAVKDCVRKKLTFDEMTLEPQHPNHLDVFTIEDCLIPARSMAKIRISSPRVTDNNVEVIVESNKFLLMRQEVAIPSTIMTLLNKSGELWVANGHNQHRYIPKGMRIGYAELVNPTYVNTLSEPF
ncbi:hypothetical protein AVEN_204843-1, partial [Araneus ventricosus]